MALTGIYLLLRDMGKMKVHYRFMEEHLQELGERRKEWLAGDTEEAVAARKHLKDHRKCPKKVSENLSSDDDSEEEKEEEMGSKKRKRKGKQKLTMDNMPPFRLTGIHPLVEGPKGQRCDCPGCPHKCHRNVKAGRSEGLNKSYPSTTKSKSPGALKCQACDMGFHFDCWNMWHGLA
jgi:hypothetical protein